MRVKESVCRHNLKRATPAHSWIEGIPVGNGTIGAMAWGGPDELRLTFDRFDLWLSPGTEKAVPALLSPNQLRRACAGTFRLVNIPASSGFSEGLDLFEAVAYRNLNPGDMQWFAHATRPCVCLRISPAHHPVQFHLQPPDLWDQRCVDLALYSHKLSRNPGQPVVSNPYEGKVKADIGVRGRTALMTVTVGGMAFSQVAVRLFQKGHVLPLSFRDGEFSAQCPNGDECLIVISTQCLRSGHDKSAPDLLDDLSETSYWPPLLEEHRQWWASYWSTTGMNLSNIAMDRLWHLGTYFLGCSVRAGSPSPVNLQGVWSDNGMTPWGGRYTWDLNVQTSYWPIYTGNRLDLGFSLYRWYRDHLPAMADCARAKFGADVEGAYLPTQTDDVCRYPGIGGSIANGAWICHNFWMHYRYTESRDFLDDFCLPVFREHLRLLRSLWRKSNDGSYHLDHAGSPELEFLATKDCPCRDSAFEIAFASFLSRAYRQALEILGRPPDALAEWDADFLDHAPPYPMCSTHTTNYYWPEDPEVPEFFVEWPGMDTDMSHRHFSHLVMLYPLGDIHRFSTYRTLRMARNSIHRLIMRGYGGWAGFSFPWASLLATRAGWPDRMPSFMLELFNQGQTIPFNGLTLNEDRMRLGLNNQTGPFGPHHLDTFTLESGMIAVTAVQDALLHTAGETIVLCGGVAPELQGEFWGLRSSSGELVSGVIENGKLVNAELNCERSGTRRFAVDSGQSEWEGNLPAFRREEQSGHTIITADVISGEKYRLRRT